ncbi:DUF2795 domain-containing protein [Prauserella cavernicola]|uniref:DUF2795 domain-containing protein n=1 Tax=Prauserella cavernicola TaxID=2800127 RepID=A0A934QWG7_9PSEU|nr:DUF2795 domain-containing protein [Prauserella cavernicola]MBK1787670.1 DUF2795 domain-containing protein [Prauserella cavernicola]
MTTRDDLRAQKALQGLRFPADKREILEYAQTRDAGEKTLAALRALPEGTYANNDDVEAAVPQSPDNALS